MKTNTTSVDKTYKLKSDATPISFTLPSRNTSRYPLLYFDEENAFEFANAVCLIETYLSPMALFNYCQYIELNWSGDFENY